MADKRIILCDPDPRIREIMLDTIHLVYPERETAFCMDREAGIQAESLGEVVFYWPTIEAMRTAMILMQVKEIGQIKAECHDIRTEQGAQSATLTRVDRRSRKAHRFLFGAKGNNGWSYRMKLMWFLACALVSGVSIASGALILLAINRIYGS